ncbi:DUF3784 domain-containing protein [Bacillus tianshenii]|uniref:DUF3784 domain-containing protein n=1 Tax=Sutcliffiella tianshenii TaxID=1463404 RepID=UPI001CD2B2CD|nr:DUF3784 domain-containing protein [Bacillus tianshenii]MCA1321205.1 DUF3784 domain-containing protein [Bacillus tianshenii]
MMWTLFFIQLGVALIFLVLGWLILFQKAYGLISNFHSRPVEEKKQLIQNGYPKNTGKMLMMTGLGMLILLPLLFTGFAYALEVQIVFMLVMLLGGFIYLSKYEVAAKRKKSYIISSSIFIITIGFVGVLTYIGYQDFQLVQKADTFEVTGVYGDEWRYEDVKRVELLIEMPKVEVRKNGFGMPTMSKGHFIVKGYGTSLLYIHKGKAPYLYVEVGDDQLFINAESKTDTQKWFEQLVQKTELNN